MTDIQAKRPRNRNRVCMACGSSQMDYRVRTHDYRCKGCGSLTTIPGRGVVA